LTVTVGAAAMSILALLVALLKAVPLAEVMQAFAILQSVALVGAEGARDLPVFSEEVSVVFTYINFSQSSKHTRGMKSEHTERTQQGPPERGKQRWVFVHFTQCCALASPPLSVLSSSLR
jgi:hypothetical protein